MQSTKPSDVLVALQTQFLYTSTTPMGRRNCATHSRILNLKGIDVPIWEQVLPVYGCLQLWSEWETGCTSVAEVRFWTDAENWNRLNRTDSSVQFQFSPATLVVSLVLGSQISSISRTGQQWHSRSLNSVTSPTSCPRRTASNDDELMSGGWAVVPIPTKMYPPMTSTNHNDYTSHILHTHQCKLASRKNSRLRASLLGVT